MSAAGISMITLGVEDLERSLTFYQAMGWKNSSHSQDSVKFLQGNNIVLGLYGRKALIEDAKANDEGLKGSSFPNVVMAINLDSQAEVDSLFKQAVDAGATAQKAPEKAFWGGYSSYIRDPDGHYWEIAHNPFVKFDANGNLKLGEIN